MRKQILSYFADTSTPFLHARGELATEHLLQRLEPRTGETILEIGFGTGATLVKLAARTSGTRLLGLERSPEMLRRARRRIQFCGLSERITPGMMNEDGSFPYTDGSVDRIYIESVLGIQEDEMLHRMLSEIQRVLKPGGRLVLNETIWLPTISSAEIETINRECRKQFGIIQANATYAYPDQWRELLTGHGFIVEIMEPTDELAESEKPLAPGAIEQRSRLFTIIGKLRGRLSPGLRNEYAGYEQKMSAIYQKKKYMEGLIIRARRE
jgi:ubiquinone/menaquinone biosynthesis C-methylase UbiE